MSSTLAGPKDLFSILQKSVWMWFGSLMDLIKLLLVPIALFSIPNAILQLQIEQAEHTGAAADPMVAMQMLGLSGLVLLTGLIYCYAAFASMRYIADRLCGRVNPNLFSYWKPHKTMLGLVGLGALCLVLFLVGMIPIVIGLILLVIPGIALTILLVATCTMLYPSYLMQPEKGVLKTVTQGLQLVMQNWWTVLLAGLLMLAASVIMMIPVFFVFLIVGIALGVSSAVTGAGGVVGMIVMPIASMLGNAFGQIGLTALTYLFYGNLYLALTGQAGDATPGQNPPPIIGTQPQSFSSPLPPQSLPGDQPPPSSPPNKPGANPWGG